MKPIANVYELTVGDKLRFSTSLPNMQTASYSLPIFRIEDGKVIVKVSPRVSNMDWCAFKGMKYASWNIETAADYLVNARNAAIAYEHRRNG